MKSTELRIGNYVKYGPNIRMVNQLDNSIRVIGCSDWIFDDNLNSEPIPLTPEILEKCGFVSLGNDEYRIDPDIQTYYIHKSINELWTLYIEGYATKSYNEWMPALLTVSDTFKYLHQLQNLYFALTNTELPITL